MIIKDHDNYKRNNPLKQTYKSHMHQFSQFYLNIQNANAPSKPLLPIPHNDFVNVKASSSHISIYLYQMLCRR